MACSVTFSTLFKLHFLTAHCVRLIRIFIFIFFSFLISLQIIFALCSDAQVICPEAGRELYFDKFSFFYNTLLGPNNEPLNKEFSHEISRNEQNFLNNT